MPDLWDDPDAARALLQKKSALERELNDFVAMNDEYNNLNELYAIAPDDAPAAEEAAATEEAPAEAEEKAPTEAEDAPGTAE